MLASASQARRPVPTSQWRLSQYPHHPPSRLPPGRRPGGVQGHILDRVCPSRTAPGRQLWVLRATAASIISPKMRSAVLSGAPAPGSRKRASNVFWHGNGAADAFAAPRVHGPEKDSAR